MPKPLSKLSLEILEIRRLQWYGLAFLNQRAFERAGHDTPEANTLAADYDAAIAEAEAIEAEVERRRSKRKGKAAVAEPEAVLEPPAELETTEPELPPVAANVIAGPWGSKLRR